MAKRRLGTLHIGSHGEQILEFRQEAEPLVLDGARDFVRRAELAQRGDRETREFLMHQMRIDNPSLTEAQFDASLKKALGNARQYLEKTGARRAASIVKAGSRATPKFRKVYEEPRGTPARRSRIRR